MRFVTVCLSSALAILTLISNGATADGENLDSCSRRQQSLNELKERDISASSPECAKEIDAAASAAGDQSCFTDDPQNLTSTGQLAAASGDGVSGLATTQGTALIQVARRYEVQTNACNLFYNRISAACTGKSAPDGAVALKALDDYSKCSAGLALNAYDSGVRAGQIAATTRAPAQNPAASSDQAGMTGLQKAVTVCMFGVSCLVNGKPSMPKEVKAQPVPFVQTIEGQ